MIFNQGGKLSGLDGVKFKKLKCGQMTLVQCIAKLFNINLSTDQHLKEWKIGYIKPLYKGDDPIIHQIIGYINNVMSINIIHL